MMNEDLKKLLGGYATGTLTEAEQKALFEAALQDQELFEALADEQPLRDMLDDPSHRAAVLAALDSGPRRHWLVRWMPALGTVAVVTVIASIAVLRMPTRVQQTPIIAEMRSSGPARSIAQENTP